MNESQDGSRQALITYDYEVSLRDIITSIWKGRWLILALAILFALIASIISIKLPDYYLSQATLVPAGDEQVVSSSLLSQFGGLVNLAGLGDVNPGVDRTRVAIEVVQSREFLSNFVKRHQLEVPLMAATAWDAEKNEWLIDGSIYNSSNKEWIRDTEGAKRGKPSNWELFEKIKKKLVVSREKNSGIIYLGFELQSPINAKLWTDWLIADLNEHFRLKDIEDAKKSITYLSIQLEKTPIREMQQLLYQLIAEQTKKMMLAEIRNDYVFKVIDPAFLPEKKTGPKRMLIILMAMMAGLFTGSLLSMIYGFSRKSLEENNWFNSVRYWVRES